MTVRAIRLFPDDVLSAACKPVSAFDSALEALVKDLFDTMLASPGVGLAAPQIGIPLRVSVIDVGRALNQRKMKSSYGGAIVLVNPTMESFHGAQVPREGCLSVPDLLANVTRYEEITVSFCDQQGRRQHMTASGFESLALQHEMDHLDGKLFLDRVANLKTDVFRRRSSS